MWEVGGGKRERRSVAILAEYRNHVRSYHDLFPGR
jgi:hypothetical protein